MNTSEAIKILEKLGHKVYPLQGGVFHVADSRGAIWEHYIGKFPNGQFTTEYSGREIVRFARSLSQSHSRNQILKKRGNDRSRMMERDKMRKILIDNEAAESATAFEMKENPWNWD